MMRPGLAGAILRRLDLAHDYLVNGLADGEGSHSPYYRIVWQADMIDPVGVTRTIYARSADMGR